MIIPFTRQLYVLMKAGIPLLKALQIVSAQLAPGRFHDTVEAIVQGIQEGKSFSESLSSAPRYFSLFYANMIRAAEVSGNLTGILKELSSFLIEQRRITRQVQAAVMYPVFVLIMAVVILVALFMFVLPVFIRIFEDLGGTLPPSTLMLIGMSKFLTSWGWLLLLLVTTFIITSVILNKKNERVRLFFNTAAWRLPLFGKVLMSMELARFCRTAGTLLASGVTLVKVLNVLLDTTQGIRLRRAIEEISYKVEQGKSLSAAMEESGAFPLTLVRMIQVGEESGKIADLFSDAASDYEEEVSFAISGLLSLLEPLLIVVMGAIVGFIVVSLFFPIFTISSLVK